MKSSSGWYQKQYRQVRIRTSIGSTSASTVFIVLTVMLLAIAPAAAAVCGNGTVEPGEDCDDGSSNGTFVNNVRITVQVLAPGDVIQFGATKYRYE